VIRGKNLSPCIEPKACLDFIYLRVAKELIIVITTIVS
jgi:hypothetical protein